MLPQIHAMPLSDFRKFSRRALKLVTEHEGHLWLTRYGKPVCGVVRLRDLDVLSAVHGRSMSELVERLEYQQERLRAGKARDRDYALHQIAERNWGPLCVKQAVFSR
jgi:hypothetical protein